MLIALFDPVNQDRYLVARGFALTALAFGSVGCGLVEEPMDSERPSDPTDEDTEDVELGVEPVADESNTTPPVPLVVTASEYACSGFPCAISGLRITGSGHLWETSLAGTGLLVRWEPFEGRRPYQIFNWAFEDSVSRSEVRFEEERVWPTRLLVHDRGVPMLATWDAILSLESHPQLEAPAVQPFARPILSNGSVHLLGRELEPGPSVTPPLDYWMAAEGEPFELVTPPGGLRCATAPLWSDAGYPTEHVMVTENGFWSASQGFFGTVDPQLACGATFDGENFIHAVEELGGYVVTRPDGMEELVHTVAVRPPPICEGAFVAPYPDICEYDREISGREDEVSFSAVHQVVAREGAAWLLEIQTEAKRSCRTHTGGCYETLPCDCEYREFMDVENATIVLTQLTGGTSSYEIQLDVDPLTLGLRDVFAQIGPLGIEISVSQQAYATSGDFSHFVTDWIRVLDEDALVP